MDWVKLAVRYYADPKVATLPDADTELLFVRGLARAGECGQAGFIPEASLPELARRRRYASLVSALVSSGLWTKVPGGYQVTGWDHWQDGIDELARRRAADRERQRRRRAAAGGVPLDPLSRDMSRDVTAPEGEGDLDLGGGTGTSKGHQSVHSQQTPPVDNHPQQRPPDRCRRHLDDPDPPNCGKCADARRAAQAWDRQQAQHRVDADRARQQHPRCRRCGQRHQPDHCPATEGASDA